MKIFAFATSIAGLTLLTACGDGSPFTSDDAVPVGTAALANEIYTVTQGDTEVALALADSNTNFDQRVWQGADGAVAYESANVLAIGGVQENGSPFAGISGTAVDAPVSDVTFTGRFGVFTAPNQYTPGTLTLNYDLETGAITNDGGLLTVNATATELGISGTVAFDGKDADMLGNFYGTDEVAGAFTGDEIGGVLYGTQQ